MQTYLFEFTGPQADAVRTALDHEAASILDRMRDSIKADFLTADELRSQIHLDLRFLRPVLASLMRVNEHAADARLAELTQVMTEYRGALRALREAEDQMIAWNARAQEEKSRPSTAAVTA